MRILELDEKNYAAFLEKQERWLYQQSPESLQAGRVKGQNCELIGLESDDGRVTVAAKIIYLRYKRFFCSAEIYFGPIFDFRRPEVLEPFLRALIPWLRLRRRSLRLRIAPLIERRRYAGLNAAAVHPLAAVYDRLFRSLGFRLLDKDFSDEAGIQARFFYQKDLCGMSFDEILASTRVSCRNDMRKAARYGVQVRELRRGEAGLFNDILEETIARSGMPRFTANFLTEADFDIYPERSFYPLAYLEVEHALAVVDEEIRRLAEQREELGMENLSRRAAARLNEILDAEKTAKKRRAEIEAIGAEHGSVVPLAVAQFFLSPSELVYSQSASRDAFRHLAPNYAIHERMLRVAAEKGVRSYNFFSINDPAAGEAEDDGVKSFKERFAGRAEELLGTYEKDLWSPF